MVTLNAIEMPVAEDVYHMENNVKMYLAQECVGNGTLCITEENIKWQRADDNEGVTLEYPYISIHGISRDTTSFPSECVFCLVDNILPGNIFNPEESETTEVRFVPGDMSNLQKIYDMIAEGQRNHPDEDDDEEDEDDMEESEFFGGEFYSESNMDNIELSEEGQAVLNRLAGNLRMPTQDEFVELIKENGQTGQINSEDGQFDDADNMDQER